MTQPENIVVNEAIVQDVVKAFTRVHRERMHDLPILNTALTVDAVGARPWNNDILLVLITPWSMNLMLLPHDEETATRWRTHGLGETMLHQFPAGRFAFIIGEEEGIGCYQMCSLFSPVLEFVDQDAAVLTASAALEALFDAATKEDSPQEQESAGEAAPTRPASVSRRGLLTGNLKEREADRS